MAKGKDALKIARQIVELETQIEPLKQQLSALQKQFEALVSGEEQDDFSLELESKPTPAPVNVTIKLKETFKESPSNEFSIQDLMQKIPGAQSSTIRSTVSRLAKENFVKVVARGHYKLEEQKDFY